MARARTSPGEGLDGDRCLDVERRLCRLERIEAPWPPFPLVEATSLLASWQEREPTIAGPRVGAEGADPDGLDAAA
jgi:hypothetical protein